MRSKLESRRPGKRTLVITLLVLGLVAGFLLMPKSYSQEESGSVALGAVNCSIGMESTAYFNGQPVTIPVWNSPLYVAGQQIDSLVLDIDVSAAGSYVDWSTLSIQAVLKSTISGDSIDQKTWTWGTGLPFDADGFSHIDAFTLTDLEALVAGATPDEVREDGVEVYNLELRTEIQGTITDVKGNILSDTLVVRDLWALQTDPNGVFTLESPEVVKPAFSSTPSDTTIDLGDTLVLQWTATDDNPDTYEITTYTPADGLSLVAAGSWSDSSILTYDVSEFGTIEPGDFTVQVTCRVFDVDGQSASDSVQITVVVPTAPDAPSFLKSEGPTSLDAGNYPTDDKTPDGWQLIIFKPRSPYPASYKIYQNGVLLEEGAWSGGDIEFRIATIYTGANDFKCVVYDTIGIENYYVHTVLSGTTTDFDPEDLPNMPFGVATAASSTSLALIVLLSIIWWRSRQE